MLNILIKIFSSITDFLIKLSSKKGLQLTSVTYNDIGRYQTYHLINTELKYHKDVLRGIYNSLMSEENFINFGKFKVIIVSAIIDGQEFNYHHNILITNNTSFDQYYNKVKDILATHFDEGYQIDVVQAFKIMVWNMDSLANKNIKITSSTVRNYKPGIKSNKTQIQGIHTSSIINKSNNLSLTHFTPLKRNPLLSTNLFATMDIETMNYNNK
uniref:hypothetical protein n=1 Tax=Polyozellus multiplex TaxID=281719 RepID=UPI001F1455B9|nr:hypothetical protein MN596_mgp14 [Polyozellus multiplex]UMI33309.1 hypothetical protein [Polyozellus multiplex]